MIAEQPKPRLSGPPTTYLVEQHKQQCCHCFRDHSFAVVYASYSVGINSRRLVLISRPADIEWNVPIERRVVPLEKIPFCHECLDGVTLGHLRKPPQLVELRTPLHISKPDAAMQAPKAAATRQQPKQIYTVDDL